MSLREEKKHRTREALRTSAFELFRTRGFDATTADDIARAAGVSRTTFFRYFPTKEAVILARPREIGETFRRLIRERPAEENPLQAFEGALMTLARATNSDPQLRAEAFAQEALLERNPGLRRRRAEHTEEQIALVAETLAEREGRALGLEHRLAAAIGLVVSEAARERWHASRGEIDAERLLEHLFSTVRSLAGHGPRPPQDRVYAGRTTQ